MNANRKSWNHQQKILRQALDSDDHSRAIELFLGQHAAVHSAGMAGAGTWSFADEVLEGMDEVEMRRIPPDGEHSAAWVLWHIACIEDITMNLLVASGTQLLHQDGWLERMKVTVQDSGNEMDSEGIARLSAAVDLPALQAYRLAVGRRTRQIISQLQPGDLKRKVAPSRLQRVRAEGAVVEAAGYILDYWGGRTIAGLLLMPPTRHNFLHLNEALRLKQKRR